MNQAQQVETKAFRTSFRLGPEARKVLESVEKNSNSTFRETLDWAIGWLGYFSLLNESGEAQKPNFYTDVLQRAERLEVESEWPRKTYVISKDNADDLNKVSKDTGISRDQLVNASVILVYEILTLESYLIRNEFQIINGYIKMAQNIYYEMTPYIPMVYNFILNGTYHYEITELLYDMNDIFSKISNIISKELGILNEDQ